MGVGGGYSVTHDERYAGGSRPYGTVDRLRPLACVFVRIGIISTAFLELEARAARSRALKVTHERRRLRNTEVAYSEAETVPLMLPSNGPSAGLK